MFSIETLRRAKAYIYLSTVHIQPVLYRELPTDEESSTRTFLPTRIDPCVELPRWLTRILNICRGRTQKYWVKYTCWRYLHIYIPTPSKELSKLCRSLIWTLWKSLSTDLSLELFTKNLLNSFILQIPMYCMYNTFDLCLKCFSSVSVKLCCSCVCTL